MTEWRTLTEELEELERTDPEVAAAAAAYDRMSWRVRSGYYRTDRSRNRRLSARFTTQGEP